MEVRITLEIPGSLGKCIRRRVADTSSESTGRTRFDRLMLVGRSSVPLHLDALKAAIAEAKRGKDVTRYREAWECLRVAAPMDPEATFDRRWYDGVEAANKVERNRLEAELKGYKNNLVKESIRVGLPAVLS
jgi:COP9 signalosome complex subunit 1